MKDVKRALKPHDRLTRIGEQLLALYETHADAKPDGRIIVFLANKEEHAGGISIGGYGDDGDMEAVADLLWHLQAIFRANGKELIVKAAE